MYPLTTGSWNYTARWRTTSTKLSHRIRFGMGIQFGSRSMCRP